MRPFESMVRSFGWLYFLPSNLSVEDGELAVGLGARDAPLRRLAGEQPALGVEQQAVGAGVLAVDATTCRRGRAG